MQTTMALVGSLHRDIVRHGIATCPCEGSIIGKEKIVPVPASTRQGNVGAGASL